MGWTIDIIQSNNAAMAEFVPRMLGQQPNDDVLQVDVGDTVSWNNQTNEIHWPWPTNADFDPLSDLSVNSGSDNYLSDQIPAGSSSAPLFVISSALAGQVIHYCCKIHPHERGKLQARDIRIGADNILRWSGGVGGVFRAGRDVRGNFAAGRNVEMAILPRSVALVPVWYAIDRKPTGLSNPNSFFSGDRHDLSYGVAEITIPLDRHRIGKLERPSIWKLEFNEDPNRHVVLHSVTPKRETDFFRGLRRRIERTNEKQAFVFIHGYNVDFKDAALRTGQMAWDLNFDGAAILYSWPSQARVRAYGVDSNNAEWTTPHLEYFLSRVSEKTGARTIHLIAHSMGNRPLINALRHFSHGSADFHEIALAAPDIDADVFMKLADEMRWAGQRVTLYASGKDRALRLSKRFNGYPRAGDVADLITIVDGIDTVDASAVDTSFMGHSYYGGSRSVLSDIFYLLRGIAVSSRAGIRPSIDGRYWLFRP